MPEEAQKPPQDPAEASAALAHRVHQAYEIVRKALDLAMANEYPKGLEGVLFNTQVFGALQYMGDELKKIFGDVSAGAVGPHLVESEPENMDVEPPEPNTPESDSMTG